MENITESGKSLAEKFQDQDVKVYLINGHVMVGIADFQGKFLHVRDPRTDNEAVVNMDHVISIARR